MLGYIMIHSTPSRLPYSHILRCAIRDSLKLVSYIQPSSSTDVPIFALMRHWRRRRQPLPAGSKRLAQARPTTCLFMVGRMVFSLIANCSSLLCNNINNKAGYKVTTKPNHPLCVVCCCSLFEPQRQTEQSLKTNTRWRKKKISSPSLSVSDSLNSVRWRASLSL